MADDPAAMTAAIFGGENYHWYYATDADRRNRVRSPITDGMAGKHWLFRAKDIFGWWSNPHHARVSGVEQAAATAWVPGMKPVWMTELGCPAIDKGANQPNVFVDPKSAESAVPYFSSRARSDSMQRRFLQAQHDWWSGGEAPAGMVDPARMFVWTWDARPFPVFPKDVKGWSDGDNWHMGHWLNGRLGAGTLADTIAAILTDHGFVDFDVSEVSGDLPGYVQGEVTSARALLEPLLAVFQIDVIEDGGVLRFRSRARASLPATSLTVLADLDEAPLWQEQRGHDSDFAGAAVVGFYNPFLDYEQASVRSRRVAAANDRVLRVDLAASIADETALIAAEQLLRDHHLSRRTVSLSLPPFDLAVQPGDVIALPDGPPGRFLVTRIEDGAARRVEARAFAAGGGAVPERQNDGRLPATEPMAAFAPRLQLMDLPRLGDGGSSDFAMAAVLNRPWRPTVLSSSATIEGFRTRVRMERPARIGTLTAALLPGVRGRFDRHNAINLELAYGGLQSAPVPAVLNGDNRLAVLADNGAYEIIGFAEAEEIAAGHWRLSGLLRGLCGSDDAMAAGASVGATVVVLDEAVRPLGLSVAEAGLVLTWIAEPAGGLAGGVVPIAFAGGLRAETPLAPVHLGAGRNVDGDIVLRWTRCGRIDADSWEGTDIALDEPEERYRLDILEGGAVRRRVETTAPSHVYSAAQELADFGAAQAALTLRVCQIGRKVPLGLPATASVSL